MTVTPPSTPPGLAAAPRPEEDEGGGAASRAGPGLAPRPGTARVAEAGLVVALSSVLSLVSLFKMPLGGSVSLASLVPLWVFARRHGVAAGARAGLACGGIQALMGTVWHPLQGLLDYGLAYTSQALAGWPRGPGPGRLAVGVVAAVAVRALAHVLSARLFFAAQVPASWDPWAYALAYNLGFLVPDALVACAGLALLLRVRPDLLDSETSHKMPRD